MLHGLARYASVFSLLCFYQFGDLNFTTLQTEKQDCGSLWKKKVMHA